MKHYSLRHLLFRLSVLYVLCTAGLGLWMYVSGWRLVSLTSGLPTRVAPAAARPKRETPRAPVRDLNAYLVERDTHYKGLPATKPRSAQSQRLEDQAALLDAYEKDPAAFLDKYSGRQQIFLFDAVIDAKNQVRVGTFADGGKWVSDPESLRDGSLVYSFGAGTEISFDADMAGRFGCEVHCFDPTPSVERSFAGSRPGQPVGNGKFSYHAVGLGPVSLDPEAASYLLLEDRKCQVKRLGELAAELGHSHVDILKIDIEGGEMAALTEILSSGTLAKLSVKQILVEFHFWDDAQWKSFVHVLSLLRQQGYLLFRKEYNPLDTRCAEYCFLGTR